MRPRAPDPHNLRAAAAAAPGPAPIIDVDRPCIGCGYNLRGLRVGINCPECGMPSIAPKGIDEPLAVMPRQVILAFIWGSWTASICVLGVIGATLMMRVPQVPLAIPRLSLCGLALMWVIAVWLLTPAFAIPQAVYYGFGAANPVRIWTRRLQLGWVVAAACMLGLWLMPAASQLTRSALACGATLGILAGLAGIVTLCLLMERLAEWTRDEDAQSKFNWAMWGLPIFTPLVMFNLPLISSVFALRLLVPLIWIIVVGLFPWALLSLCKSVTLSIVHSYEHEDRSKRREERNQKYQDYVGGLVDKMDGKRS